ncbi:hypothetical protein BGX27_011022 [Mortierella sp. AM989]|nr:hypothetical protein BGX27_011022 [Mortierella sp. AM989]
MSSTNNDTKSPENEERPPSDLNVVDDESPTTLSVTSITDAASKKTPSSPHTAPVNASQEVEDDDDLEIHPAVPVTTTVATENTSVAAVTSPTISTTSPTVVHTQAPTAPASEREVKLAILTEAFPTVEKEVCEFVLESHRGDVEASINALLEISDPEFQPEPQQQQQPQQVPSAPATSPPALPRRQEPDDLTQDVANMNLGQNQPRAEIDPILLASTSTSEQQLRADEDFARTLAAMDEYREELPKIKERLNVAADTTKKKVTEWYNIVKAKAEAAQAQRNASQAGNSSNQERRDTIVFDNRLDEDEPLARHRVTPPLSGSGEITPPLPARPYNVGNEATATNEPLPTVTNSRRTTLEDELDIAMNANPSPIVGRRI